VAHENERRIEKAPKHEIAGAILDEVARLLEERDGRGR
jgi:hypothetical protein